MKDCCKGDGVQCSDHNITSHVTTLDLHDQYLRGKISPSLRELHHLSDNLEWLSHLSLLNHLDLSEIDLSKATGWVQSIYGNNLTEELHELLQKLSGARKSLQILGLSANRLKGPLPDFTRFSLLRKLGLGNNLEWVIPKKHWKPSESCLSVFDGESNYGVIPRSFSVSLLGRFRISKQSVEWDQWTIYRSIGQLHRLKSFNCAFNSLKGIISEAHIPNLSSLSYLDFSYNALTCNFSSDWVPSFQLYVIMLSSCKLGPRFPNWL
ncbi:hypothetical protein Vadar_033873 [Vaccinium darrowii]|nr:hypothetical protein Vadar_033873 [Vaccinium darrowii]